MSTEIILKSIAVAVEGLNLLISLTGSSAKYRQLIANAVAEGRDVSEAELDYLRESARQALARARED